MSLGRLAGPLGGDVRNLAQRERLSTGREVAGHPIGRDTRGEPPDLGRDRKRVNGHRHRLPPLRMAPTRSYSFEARSVTRGESLWQDAMRHRSRPSAAALPPPVSRTGECYTGGNG